jgi:ADP-heptose:LPS heptosyltransferase
MNKVFFVGFDRDDYQHFVKHACQINYYKPTSLLELFVIINSCKMFIGSLSSPLSMALGLHAPTKIGFFGKKVNHCDYQYFHLIGKNIPSVKNRIY